MSKVGEYERELRAMQDNPAYILRNGVREDKENNYMCANCGGGFSREEMNFDAEYDTDLCNYCYTRSENKSLSSTDEWREIEVKAKSERERRWQMKWIDRLLPIIEEYRDGGEALDGDEVDSLCSILRAKINLHEGNITETEYNNILDGGNK